MTQPKVFIVHKGDHNYKPAEQFGELVFLTGSEARQRYDLTALYTELDDALEGSTDKDFLMISGLPVMIAVANGILVRKHGAVRYLVFKYGRYVEQYLAYAG